MSGEALWGGAGQPRHGGGDLGPALDARPGDRVLEADPQAVPSVQLAQSFDDPRPPRGEAARQVRERHGRAHAVLVVHHGSDAGAERLLEAVHEPVAVAFELAGGQADPLEPGQGPLGAGTVLGGDAGEHRGGHDA